MGKINGIKLHHAFSISINGNSELQRRGRKGKLEKKEVKGGKVCREKKSRIG